MPVVFVSVEAWDLGYAMWKAHAQPAKQMRRGTRTLFHVSQGFIRRCHYDLFAFTKHYFYSQAISHDT